MISTKFIPVFTTHLPVAKRPSGVNWQGRGSGPDSKHSAYLPVHGKNSSAQDRCRGGGAVVGGPVLRKIPERPRVGNEMGMRAVILAVGRWRTLGLRGKKADGSGYRGRDDRDKRAHSS